jgi:hypothetical protein
MNVVREAGFENVRVGCLVDVFSGSAHESDAKDFDTRGIVFSAVKAGGG